MKEHDIKLGYNDVSIMPEVVTDIRSRKECNPFDENGMLPIFASPMDSVVDEENIEDFVNNKINTIIPRTVVPIKKRIELSQKYNCFFAISLQEAEDAVRDFLDAHGPQGWIHTNESYKVCIDIANGHMTSLLDICVQLKRLPGVFFTIMTGNIANPETYRAYENAGVDYVRCTIGSGSGCLTASNTGIYFPSFSLIKEIYEYKVKLGGKCKIIADGGIRGYRDIQKALIYADYVMIGGLFNKAIESAGKTTYGNSYFNVNGKKIFRPFKTLFTYGREIQRKDFGKAYALFKENKLSIWKEFYGMSSKRAQAKINPNAKIKTSEGKTYYQRVEFNLSGWVENEIDYLRSAMSYTNSRNLNEYKNSKWVVENSVAYNQ